MITRRVLQLVSAVCVLGLAASGASANLLNPGATGVTPDTSLPTGGAPSFLDGTPVGTALAQNTVTFSSSRFSGTLTEAVYRNASNTLDFFYQFQDSSSSIDGIEKMTVSDFSGFLVDAGWVSTIGTADTPFTAGTFAPTAMDRSGGTDFSAVIAYDFPGSANAVLPGGTSQILFAVTNATTFNIGNVSFIDGTTSTVLGFAPLPEASTMAGFGLLFALGGIGMLRLRRRSMGAASA